MKRDILSQAIDHLDDRFISEAMEYRGGRNEKTSAPERNIIMFEKKKLSRRIAAIAAAACIVLGMGVTAYAANYWGIRDMLGRNGHALPDGAEEYIEPRGESAAAGALSAKIIESLCSTDNVVLTVDVTSEGDYILVPTDASEGDPVSDINVDGNMTLGEYAQSKGKTLLPVGAWVDSAENDLGISSAASDFNCVSDSEMIIYIKAWKDVSKDSLDLVCTIYPSVESGLEKVEIPFTATEGHIREIGVYEPSDANAVPGMVLGEAYVTETPLGLSIRMRAEVTDDEKFYSTLLEVEGVDFLGGFVHDHDNVWNAQWTDGKGEIGEEFTVDVRNIETGEHICDVIFARNKD